MDVDDGVGAAIKYNFIANVIGMEDKDEDGRVKAILHGGSNDKAGRNNY